MGLTNLLGGVVLISGSLLHIAKLEGIDIPHIGNFGLAAAPVLLAPGRWKLPVALLTMTYFALGETVAPFLLDHPFDPGRSTPDPYDIPAAIAGAGSAYATFAPSRR